MGDYKVGHMLELAKGDAFAIVALYERYPDECASEIVLEQWHSDW